MFSLEKVNLTIVCALSCALAIECIAAPHHGSLGDLIQRSDAVVVARIESATPAHSRPEIQMTVIRSIKGALLPGNMVRANYPVIGKAARAPVSYAKEPGLLFMKSGTLAGAWELVSAETGALGIRDSYISLATEDPPRFSGNTPLDMAYAELLTSAERSGGDLSYLQRLLLKLDPSASPLVQKAFQEWRSSPSLALRTEAMRSLIFSGDTQALLQSRPELELPSTSFSHTLGGALGAFRSTDPVAIKILGELAASSKTPLETRRSAASALYALHTKDTLPYLVQLLDSPDKILQVNAVSGLSAFALHMRMIDANGDGADALDEVMNPGRRRKIPDATALFDTDETRQNVHFGTFRDEVEESRYLNYWKSWFQRNRSQAGIQ